MHHALNAQQDSHALTMAHLLKLMGYSVLQVTTVQFRQVSQVSTHAQQVTTQTALASPLRHSVCNALLSTLAIKEPTP